jgi:hypothetical protein
MIDGRKPPIRDVIRQVLAERGHSISEAERTVGMKRHTLASFLRWERQTMSDERYRKLARYLGLSFAEVKRWVERDRARGRGSSVKMAHIDGTALTWWGEVGKPTVDPQRAKCRRCPAADECRQAAAAGRPLPCEAFLERELVPEHAIAQMEARNE